MSAYSIGLIELILIFAIAFILFKFIDIFNKDFANKILSKNEDATILRFLPLIDKLLKVVILFVALATILESHGYSIGSLIAGFGITGLAVGFGAQTTIANVFGSFALLFDKAYKVGDYIVINQTVHDRVVEGTVEDINLRSTKIRCADGALLIIPNNTIANGVVKNVSQTVN
jgi:small-conductance mechanosensitive channel